MVAQKGCVVLAPERREIEMYAYTGHRNDRPWGRPELGGEDEGESWVAAMLLA